MCTTKLTFMEERQEETHKPWRGHKKHEEEDALIDGELFGLRAKCYVYLDPRCQAKHAIPTVESGGSWPLLVGREMELNSGQSCRPDTGAEVHRPGGK